MAKFIKRFVSGAMAAMMISSAVLGAGFPTAENDFTQASAKETVNVTDVTGKFNLSNLRLENFNDKVLQILTPTKYEKKTVIVSLTGNSLLDEAGGQRIPEYIATNAAQKVLDNIESKQNAFLKRLTGSGINYTLKHRYNAIDNALAIEINEEYIDEIQAMPGVESVVVSRTYDVPKTIETDTASNGVSSGSAVTNETSVYKTGIYDSTGYSDYSTGTVVAILDTGLDYTHPAFKIQPPESTLGLTKNEVQSMLANNAFAAEDRTALSGEELSVSDVFVSNKVPFAYDYADDDADVYPSYSNHGTHVAGIVAGQDTSYTNKDGETAVYEEGDKIPDGANVGDVVPFIGVAPNAQLVICKVFTDDLDSKDLGGAITEDILAALQDCVLLGVDVINMSLGTSAGFSQESGDDEGDYLDSVYQSIQDAGISLVCAASNDYSSAYGGTFGTNRTENPDSATVGSPSTFSAALSVASISGQKSEYILANAGTEYETAVYYIEANDRYNNPIDFADGLLGEGVQTGSLEYVVVPGTGQASDYTAQVKRLFNQKPNERIALVKRGDISFEDKVRIAKDNKAAAVIVYNNVAGEIRMSLGELDDPIPAISIDREAGEEMFKVVTKTNRIGTITINRALSAGPFMSDFSSWGPTPDLKLKPEITAHGGEITSTVPGGYDEQSGTSMASPNMAGFTAIARSFIKQNLSSVVAEMVNSGVKETVAINRLVNQLIMSTATTAYDEDNLAYSPRKQGAGLASMSNVVGGTSAYLYTNVAENDYRPKVELFDKLDEKDNYEIEFYIHNFDSAKTLNFTLQALFMTESLDYDGYAVAEQAYMLDDNAPTWFVGEDDTASNGTVSVAPGQKLKIKAVLSLSADEKAYIEENFKNGMYIEGFIKLLSTVDGQCDLTLPFLGFYGDWSAAPMLDYDVYEVAADEKDASLEEADKRQESVWATQPFATYQDKKYVIPMGSYVYLLPEHAEKMWADADKASVSKYNIIDPILGEEAEDNYLTTYAIRALYAGLLRNARTVNYKVTDLATGALIKTDTINRVGKAYTAGGGGRPANVEIELEPEALGLVSNGKYEVSFEFLLDYGDGSATKNTYAFSFYVDYDAPVLDEARIRYENYKDGNKQKQKIWLDLDVFDNHYAQSVLLCYADKMYNFEKDEEEDVLKLATEYVTPIRNANKNGTTTVSIDITDLYDDYKVLYAQIDDYALNNALYMIEITSADGVPTPKTFELADGEENVTVDVYGTHKVSLVYEGNADLSNFTWTSSNKSNVQVKNGEIVGLKANKSAVVIVSNGKGVSRRINVNVTSNTKTLDVPSISFGVIQASGEWLTKAQGVVEVNSNEQFTLEVLTDPWYYPTSKLELLWESKNTDIAEVDQTGKVTTKKKGTASIVAYLCRDGFATSFTANVTLIVKDDFDVSNYTLNKYNGVGYNGVICPDCHSAWTYDELETLTVGSQRITGVCPTETCLAAQTVISDCQDTVLKIPADRNIMYIGLEAFKDNDNIKKVVIPKSVVEIQEKAFVNCTALEEIYFVDTVTKDIADAMLSLVHERAFYHCTALKTLDLSNAKTFTVGMQAFRDCTSLETIVKPTNIGTMHHYAFMNCTSLEEIDLSGLHMSGHHVFAGCSNLARITTGEFTAIGDYMFSGCNKINSVTLSTGKIGRGAFEGCTGLESVVFDAAPGVVFEIDANAFRNCKNLSSVDFTTETIRVIGDYAFAGTALNSFTIPNGVEMLGEGFLKGALVTSITLTDSFDIAQVRLTGLPFENISVIIPDNSSVYYKDNASGIVYNKDKTTVLLATEATGIVELLDTVSKIAEYAFAGSKVTKITIPSGVDSIGEYAFADSTLAEIVFVGNNLTEIKTGTFYNSKLTSVSLPSNVKVIEDYAFAGTLLTTFGANDFVGTTLGNSVFENCKQLATVTLNENIKSIGNYTFIYDSALTHANMPAVTSLGEFTFYGCSSLESVVFADGATDLGTLTFTATPVRSVTLSIDMVKIPDGDEYYDNGAVYTGGVFSGCLYLQSINLEHVKEIGSYAFAGCTNLSGVNGLQAVEKIGDYAFMDCNALGNIALGATQIGKYAFAINNGGETYTQLTLNNTVTIGDFAFMGGGMSTIVLPATLEKVGDGAFTNAINLTAFTVAGGDKFVTNLGGANGEGVLYQVVPNGYKLVTYPAGKASSKVDGKAKFVVADGTVSVQANAFTGLKDGAVDVVELPYTMKSIGDSAFYDSGVLEYVFNSVNAPVLETKYQSVVSDYLSVYLDDKGLRAYYGYYYSNFEDLAFNYSKYVGVENPLVIYYPENGVGYDTLVYTSYFGTKNVTGIVIDDTTRAFRDALRSFPAMNVVQGWAGDTGSLAQVLDFASVLTQARTNFNAIKSASQLAFLDEGSEEKLLAYESTMRSVKASHGITVNVQRVYYKAEGYKVNYLVGEYFDPTGLEIIVLYDDGSSEIADLNDFTLVTNRPLTERDAYVEYQGHGKRVRVDVVVSEQPSGDDPQDSSSSSSSSSSTEESSGGCNGTVESVYVMMTLAAVAAFVILKKKGFSK